MSAFRRARPLALVAAGLLAATFVAPAPVQAATIIVTTGTDELTTDGQCSLREAVRNANANLDLHSDCLGGNGADIIDLTTAPYSITLRIAGANEDAAMTGDLDVTGTLTIRGRPKRRGSLNFTSISPSNPADRIFDVLSVSTSLTITGVQIENGDAGGNTGGCIRNISGQVALTDVTLVGCRMAGLGGTAISSSGSLALDRVEVRSAYGGVSSGAVSSTGTLTITRSSIFESESPIGTINGIRIDGGTARLTNVTIARHGLTASAPTGAGILVTGTATVSVLNSTIVGNHTGIRRTGGSIFVANTIVADNAPGVNCDGTVSSAGYNLSDDASCNFNQPGDLPANTNARLSPYVLSDPFGSTTTTVNVQHGSPAIDAGNPATPLDGLLGRCVATDQRGVSRPRDGDAANGARCDIGASEQVRITVDSTVDEVDALPGDSVCATSAPVRCTLRAAVMEVTGLGSGVIVVPSSSTPYTLTRPGDDDDGLTGDLDLSATSATILGGGAATTIVDGGALDRVLTIYDGVTEISDITIRNGFTTRRSSSSNGAGIRVEADTTIRRSVIRDNESAGGGGGIGVTGRVTLIDSIIEGNTTGDGGGGGGIDVFGNATITGSTIEGNTATNRSGGGIAISGQATIVDSIIEGNTTGDSSGGGGIDVSGVATITGSTIEGNTAIFGDGGGIIIPITGEVTITSSTIEGNTATNGNGGGIAVIGQATITSSTIEGNDTNRQGGGIAVLTSTHSAPNRANLKLSDSTITDNEADQEGGGFASVHSDVYLTNVTVSTNRSAVRGGGVYLFTTGEDQEHELTNVTIAHNQAPSAGGFQGTFGGGTSVRNTIIANNTGGDCIAALLTSHGFNLSSDASCNLTEPSDPPGVDPRLGLLTDNGGPVWTHALLATSPAIDNGNPTLANGPNSYPCATTDGRGLPRPRDGDGTGGPRCDIGAFELQAPYPADLAIAMTDGPDPTQAGRPLTYTITVTNNGPATANLVTVTDTLPAGVTFVSAASSAGTCSGTATVICRPGNLAVGQSATATIVVTPTGIGQLSNTATVAASSPPDPNQGNNTVTATTAVPINCQTRPNVRVTTARGALGQLSTTLAAQTSANVPTNSLVSVRIIAISNATVQLNGSPITSGPAVTLPAGTLQATLLVTRQAPGQNPALPSTVRFEVTDSCGAWPSFVGGRPGAF